MMRATALLGGIALIVGVLEIALRIRVAYNPHYYDAVGTKGPQQTLHFPWGEIYFNRHGYPDDEFFPEKIKPRVMYIGDSVCYGTGAGRGYRATDLLDRLMPEFEHMNHSSVATGITYEIIDRALEFVDQFQVDKVVYIMNLNDIMLTIPSGQEEKDRFFEKVRRTLDGLRGSSYLYSYLRFTLVKTLLRFNIRHDGRQSAELFPTQFNQDFADTAARVNEFASRLQRRGVPLTVVIIPYEMQISEPAARAYADLGIQWDSSFLERGPQKKIEAQLDPGISVVDAYYAFVGSGGEQASRAENQLGQYYVYNRGDKLDWNHPNREGHRLIAEYISENAPL